MPTPTRLLPDSDSTRQSLAVWMFAGFVLFGACTPLRDLDKAAAGGNKGGASNSATRVTELTSGGADSSTSDTALVGSGGTFATTRSLSTPVGGASVKSPVSTTSSGGTNDTTTVGESGGASTGGASAGGASTGGGSNPGSGGMGGKTGVGGTTATGGTLVATATGGTGTTTATIAPDLPDLPNSPVQGFITYSSGASWDIDGVQAPAYRIETPTATYFLVKDAAAIVSIDDQSNMPWIAFSSGYRPNRGVPNLGGCCQPGNPTKLGLPVMSTEVDLKSVTSTHLRLNSKSVGNDDYWLVWDFYVTHVTVTVNRSKVAFGFTYHGVPGSNLDPEDQLVLSTGTARSASNAFAEDLPGPVEWAYLTNPGGASPIGSLFVIQHQDDNVAESYLVADGNSSKFTFGGGKLTTTPIRFSLGLINSVDHTKVSERVAFVVSATPH